LRAREKSLSVVSYRQKGRRPQCYTRAGRARARARARAKYPGHFRPAKKRPHQWIFEFFLREWLELDEILPTIATKTKNSKKICDKKFVSKIAFPFLLFAPSTSMSHILPQRRLEPLFKIDIDEGEGGKIMANWTFLSCFTDRSIAPMFSWIFPTPKRINPIAGFCGSIKKTSSLNARKNIWHSEHLF